MAVTPAVAIGISLALTAASTGMAVASSIQQGQAQKKSANYQASVAERQAAIQAQNAKLAEQQTEAAVKDRREQARRLAGANRAAGGASGVELSGSFLDVERDNLYTSELDVANIRFGGDMQSMNLMEESTGFNMQARFARQQGKSASKAGYMNAIGAGIKGASSMASTGYSGYSTGAFGGNRNTLSGVNLG